VDSRALHEAAWNETAREFGREHTPEHFARHFGTQNWRAISEILGWTSDPAEIERISSRKEALYRQRLHARSELLVPGVRDFLEALAGHGVPAAVVSSSSRLNIDRVIDALSLRLYFVGIVSAEDARRGKPDPDCFLLGAERIGLSPRRCVVFEDAPAGVESGRRAGMRVVALTTTHPAGELQRADHIVNGWSPEVLERVASWF
jgi:HAD superfamily hydrolase (TIGR01509 family)